MADTRKDKRAPISLKVRFKSATLDEFIEQYSSDISRGGIFIKSKTPMSVGTLLKFEFQLKDESRLIHGVGRVVWKRESGDADAAPGMGIKFIKMDPESRSLVDQMVKKRGEAPGRFEEGQDGAKKPAEQSGGFFPSTTPESELPAPEDRTQVRHASEFLASALAEGDASASEEAEKKAEEARKRTEEIERKRAEAKKKKRKPRIKKTLVGMGIPAAGEDDEDDGGIAPPGAAPSTDAEETKDESVAAASSDSAETKALDRSELEKPGDAEEAEKPADADAEAEEPKAEPQPEEKAGADAEETKPAAEPEDEKPAAEEKKPEPEDEKPAAEEKKPEDEKPAAEKTPEPEKEKPAAAKKKKPEPRAKKPVDEKRPVVEVPAAAAAPAEEEPKSRAAMVFFALIAAAAIGVIVWMEMRPEEPTDTGADTTVGTEPTEDEGLEGEGDEALEGEEDLAAEGEGELEEPVVETTPVRVETDPEGATILVDGEERGAAPREVELPLGQVATVSARMNGYSTPTQEVTAEEGQETISLALEALPYVISVVTEPEGARVRGGGGRATGPGEISLRGAPDEAIELTAIYRGHERTTATVEPAAFTEQEGRMVASVTITLEERERPVRQAGGGGGQQGGGGGQAAGGGQQGGGQAAGGGGGGGGQAAGGGGTEESGGGGGGGQEAGGGGGAEESGGGGGGGQESGGGGAEESGGGGGGGGGEEEAPPDNPFG